MPGHLSINTEASDIFVFGFGFLFFSLFMFCFAFQKRITFLHFHMRSDFKTEINKQDIADIFDAYFSHKGNSLSISQFNKFSNCVLLYVSPYLLLW